jgi:poly-gamma-glutamate capsule biosynthesis protein CapA/YwtB (metallophosphatase superfamily)
MIGHDKVGAVMLAGLVLAANLAVAAPSPTAVPEGFTFAAGGDMIGPYHDLPKPQDSGFAQIAALFRGADLSYANQEGSIFDIKDFRGYPAAENGGGYPLQRSAFARDIKGMGISLVSKANNHATDWGSEGLAATLGWLAAAGVTQAGAGEGLDAARAPAYLQTVKGRVALVSTASTFPPMAVAGPPVTRFDTPSRARIGISALHVREVGMVTPQQLQSLRQIVGPLDFGGSPQSNEVRLGDQVFRAGAKTGQMWEANKDDQDAILNSVKAARAKAKFVVFSIHAHQTAGHKDDGGAPYEHMVLHWANEAASSEDPRPANFEPALFHAAIDAGADAVVRTGPHVLGGIEIYKGKPIFYSLGSLFFDFRGKRSYTPPTGQVMKFPDGYFQTVIPVTRYAHGKVEEIRLYPFAIESGGGPMGGMPRPASAAEAQRILENLKSMSAAFGTKISIKNGIGIIHGS